MVNAKKHTNCIPLPKCIYIYWKILGLCPFSIDGNEIIYYSKSGIIYGVFLALGYSLVYLKLIIESGFQFYYLPTNSAITTIVNFVGLFIEFALIVCSWVQFALSQKKFKKIIKKCKIMTTKMKLIGIEQNYAKNFQRITFQVIIVNVLWLALNIADQILVCLHDQLHCNAWVTFSFPRITNHNIILMFIYAIMPFEKYYSLLNEKISDLRQEITPMSMDSQKIKRLSVKQSGLVTHVTMTPLETYGQLHSDLVKLTNLIIDYFTLSVILSLLAHVVLMACDMYFICILIKTEKPQGTEAICTIIVMFFWLLFHIVETMITLAIPDSIVKEANRTGTVLHEMLTLEKIQKYTSTGQLVSLRLFQEHLTINLWGLFKLKISVMYTIIGTICAYVTIMMQLDDFKLVQPLSS